MSGDDLLIMGGNRSGKTLTFNALLYGLYGPQATFGVSPGRKSTVRFHFDDDDIVERGGGGRKYSHGDETYEKGKQTRKSKRGLVQRNSSPFSFSFPRRTSYHLHSYPETTVYQ
ncbi:ATP-binding protein [Saliphagus sp. GCM10025308]